VRPLDFLGVALRIVPFAVLGAFIAAQTYGVSVVWAILAVSFLVVNAARGKTRTLVEAAIAATRGLIMATPLYLMAALFTVLFFLMMLGSVEGSGKATFALIVLPFGLVFLLTLFVYAPAAIAEGHGAIAALSASFRVARQSSWLLQIFLAFVIVIALLVGGYWGPVALTLAITAIVVIIALRFTKISEPINADPTRPGPWATAVFLGLELVTLGCFYQLATELPPPEDLGPTKAGFSAPQEVVHPSGERSRIVTGNSITIERLSKEGAVLARTELTIKSPDHVAILPRGERLGVATTQSLHYVTYSEDVRDNEYVRSDISKTVALHTYGVEAMTLEPTPDGVEIRLLTRGFFLPIERRLSRVRVPDSSMRTETTNWHADLPPRRRALFDVFPGFRVLGPLFGPMAALGWIAAALYTRRFSAMHRLSLAALPVAAFSAILAWLGMGFGM